MAGVAELERGEPETAVKCLAKALELARESGAAMQDDIWRELGRAKHAVWVRSGGPQRGAQRSALREKLLRCAQPSPGCVALHAVCALPGLFPPPMLSPAGSAAPPAGWEAAAAAAWPRP